MKILMLGSAKYGPTQPRDSANRHLADQRWTLKSVQRRHAAIAISQDGRSWMLLGAPLDLLQRLRRHSEFATPLDAGGNPVRAVLLTNSSLRHGGGLLTFQDARQLDLYCTPAVVHELQPLMAVVNRRASVRWRVLPVWSGSPVASFRLEFAPSLRLRAFVTSASATEEDRGPGTSIALIVDDLSTGGRLFYASQLKRIGEPERLAMQQADCAIINDTVWKKQPGESVLVPSSLHAAQAGAGMPGEMPDLTDVRDLLGRIGHAKPQQSQAPATDVWTHAPGGVDYPGITFDV